MSTSLRVSVLERDTTILLAEHDTFNDASWILNLTEYIRDIVSFHKKLLAGIGFGHQILARTLGARHPHQMHRDIVMDIPEGYNNLGSSPMCAIHGLYMPMRLLTVQAHTEFNDFIMSCLLETKHDNGGFNDKTFKDEF
ncbi:hypothetical protein N7495_009904 [Penicillium taxi]|uniref:uncharacterized protein n=1 Tax=Penicillium taxi TaxID=168475 RepID=UPI002544DDB5|nr:uncharacterized protein N7495_009904 [Penicillium taxi]KAJ5885394.1 hypothetical protein N7495_009904 [Penicillium taxi]